MPTTPNRGYPYPAPTDTPDVPRDICALADAVNADLLTVAAQASAKPIVQVRASQPQVVPKAAVVPGTVPDTPLVFDSVDVDTGGFSALATKPTLLTLPVGPAYWVWATVRFPGYTNATDDPCIFFRIVSVDMTPVFIDNEVYTVDNTVLSRVHTIGGLFIPTSGDEEIQARVNHNSDAATQVFTEATFGAIEIRPVA